jgi:hypothetical protein
MTMKIAIASLILLGCVGITNAQPWHYNILWQREGVNGDSHYGSIIGALGDQNQDGFADWAVNASGGGRAGQPNENYVEFFHGGNPPAQEPYMVFRANPQIHWDMDGFFPAGDLNGDGFMDWIVEFRPLENFRIVIHQIYFGGPNSDTIPELAFHTSWDVFLSAMGDYNGDGFDDIYGWDQTLDRYMVYYGGQSMDSIPDLNLPTLFWSFGDLNGDHFTDAIGSNSNNDILFFYGGPHPDILPHYSWPNVYNVAADIVNDLNGDGFDDFVLSRDNTRMEVHFGRRDTLSSIPNYYLNYAPILRCENLGDINHDGFNDLAAIHEFFESCAIFLGHPWLNPNPVFVLDRDLPPLNIGSFASIAGLGDINGDGVGDFAVGGSNRAFVLSGDSTYHVDASPTRPEIVEDLRVKIYPNPCNAEAIIQLNLPLYADHVNIRVFDVLGRGVFETDFAPTSMRTVYHLDAHSFASGIYFLNVRAGALFNNQKLAILK